MHNLSDNLQHIRQRITSACQQAGRDPAAVTLLAVSKTRPASDIRRAYAAQQCEFGENYLQEALDKQSQLTDLAIVWHFIGPIQANKTRAIAEHFAWAHSIDRLKIAQRLNDQRPSILPPLNVCLQVNLDHEESKSGIDLAKLPDLVEAILTLPRLSLRGLMVIPAPRENPDEQRQVFATLCAALHRLQESYPEAPLDTLSMGMSGDMEAAIAAGSTMVRIGTDIFGQRDTSPPPRQNKD